MGTLEVIGTPSLKESLPRVFLGVETLGPHHDDDLHVQQPRQVDIVADNQHMDSGNLTDRLPRGSYLYSWQKVGC